MSQDTDFSQRPFVAGSLIGVRTFSVGPVGHLTGVVQKYPYLRGENLATCIRPDRAMNTLFMALGGTLGEEANAREAAHQLVGLPCTCGFYAYFDGSNPYGSGGASMFFGRSSKVTGLIEGYGRTVVGSKGFRAEKARIVALVYRTERSERHRDLGPFSRILLGLPANPAPSPSEWAAIRHLYPDVPMYDSLDEALEAHPLTVPDPEVV